MNSVKDITNGYNFQKWQDLKHVSGSEHL